MAQRPVSLARRPSEVVRRRVRAGVCVGVIASTMFLAGCSSQSSPTSCHPHGSPARLVAGCGTLFGIATQPHSFARLKIVERTLGLRFDLVYRFHDIDDRLPTADERALVADDRVLHISIDARRYQDPGHRVAWSAVASGAYDAALSKQARGVASLRAPVFLTFDHEPDQPQRRLLGSPSDFVAAWRHVHDLFVRAGATNAVWVWVVTGYGPTRAIAARMWPGNSYVDWISWEAYNASGCREGHTDPAQFQSFDETALPFYWWIRKHGPPLGIDVSKPMMISEAGSVVYSGDPGLTAKWYQQIPGVLAQHPQIRAIALWDRHGIAGCGYDFDHSALINQAVSTAGSQPPITAG